MRKRSYRLTWSNIALDQFIEILEFIEVDSPVGAEIVREAILQRVDQLKHYPFMYEPDALCDPNDGSFRAFTVYSYRITYWVSTSEVTVLRVRHTSREPFPY